MGDKSSRDRSPDALERINFDRGFFRPGYGYSEVTDEIGWGANRAIKATPLLYFMELQALSSTRTSRQLSKESICLQIPPRVSLLQGRLSHPPSMEIRMPILSSQISIPKFTFRLMARLTENSTKKTAGKSSPGASQKSH